MNMIITTSLPIPDKIMITNVMVFTICMLAITFDIFSTHSADYKAKKFAGLNVLCALCIIIYKVWAS